MSGMPAESLRELYAAFNVRDIDAAVARMAPDVDWPNAWEGGRLTGRDAVRDYWSRQWAAIDPVVEPLDIVERPDGSVAVDVAQVVRSLDGSLLARERVRHVYVLQHGLISRMDVEERPA
jgi:hypothetical protein